jgi:hypothetical protein
VIRLVLRVVSLALAAAAIAGAIAVGALLPAAPGPTTQTVRDAGVVTDLPAAPAAPSAPQARK